MPRTVRLAIRSFAAGVVILMLSCVPTVCGHVDAAAGRHFIIDHDNLLVVAAPNRVRAVQLQLDLFVHCPFGDINHRRSAPQHFKRAKIPFEQFDFKTGFLVGQPQDKFAQPFGRVAFLAAAAAQVDAGIEIPTDQHDPVFGIHHRRLNYFEIWRGIDNRMRSRRFHISPDALAFGCALAHSLSFS